MATLVAADLFIYLFVVFYVCFFKRKKTKISTGILWGGGGEIEN